MQRNLATTDITLPNAFDDYDDDGVTTSVNTPTATPSSVAAAAADAGATDHLMVDIPMAAVILNFQESDFRPFPPAPPHHNLQQYDQDLIRAQQQYQQQYQQQQQQNHDGDKMVGGLAQFSELRIASSSPPPSSSSSPPPSASHSIASPNPSAPSAPSAPSGMGGGSGSGGGTSGNEVSPTDRSSRFISRRPAVMVEGHHRMPSQMARG